MANSRKLIVEVVGDSTKLDRSLKGIETRTQKFSRRMAGKSGVGGGMLFGGVGKAGVIGAGVAVGSALAVKGLKKVVAAAKEAEVAEANLGQAFQASGVSSAKFGQQVDRAIQSTSKLAAFDDEEVSQSFASLLRTTGSVAKATRDVALAANIARARKISLAAAAKVVEKAENGQLRGLKALGVAVDSTMTSEEALGLAQKKFAGSAEAYGRTAAGAQDKLAVAFENLEEKVGAKLLPTLTKLTLKLVELIDWSDRNWPRFAKAVEDAYRRVKPIVDAELRLYKAVAEGIAGMVKIVHGLFTGDWQEAWDGFKQYAVDGIGGVVKAALLLPAKIAKALGGKAMSALKAVGTQIGNAIRDGVFAVINKMIDGLNKVGGALNKALPGNPVPKLGRIGGSSSAGTGRRPDEGTRGPIVVQASFNVDGKALNHALTPHRQQAQKRNPAQRRGPNAGLVSA